MLAIVRKCYDIFTRHERIKVLILLGALCGVAMLNMAGVASVLPFLMVLQDPGIVETDERFRLVYEGLGFSDHSTFVIFAGLVVVALNLFTIAARSFTTYLTLRFTAMRSFDISQRVLAGYLAQPYDWYLNRHTSAIAKTLLSEVQQFLQGAVSPLINLVSNALVIATLAALLVAIDWRAALSAAVVLTVVYATIFTLVRNPLKVAGAKRLEFGRRRFKVTQEVLGGIKEVKILGIEQGALNRYRAAARQFAHQQARTGTLRNVSQQSLEAIAFATMMGIVLTLYVLNSGQLETILPLLGAYAAASMRLIPAVKAVFTNIATLRADMPLVDALHAEYTELVRPGIHFPTVEPLPLRDRISLRDVTYAFPGASNPTLRGITLDIPARKTIGIVGGTGAGKTTTLDIILGLLVPSGGTLVIDDQAVDTNKLRRRWQHSIGYVPQQIFIAADTVAANIAFGIPKDKIDHAALERAAQLAQIHDFIMTQMPDGYDSLVGERGVKLSGGQRQRLGIARALYRDPAVLILDEATSALDNVTERDFMDAIDALGGQKTIVMVAHRLSTVRDCDLIFLLEHGRVIASGRYDDLVGTSESFRKMALGAA